MLAPSSGGAVSSVVGRTGDILLAVGDVSGAAPLDSPGFTGSPTALNPLAADNSTRLATTAFVKAQAYAPLASPTFTGTVTLPLTAGSIPFIGTGGVVSQDTNLTWSTASSYLKVRSVGVAFGPEATNTGMGIYSNGVKVGLYNFNGDITFTTRQGTGAFLDTWRVTQAGVLIAQRQSSTAARDVAQIDVGFDTNTDASRKGFITLSALDFAGTRLGIKVGTDGTQALVGLFGATPVARQTITGSRGANAALASLLTALASLGAIVDSTTA